MDSVEVSGKNYCAMMVPVSCDTVMSCPSRKGCTWDSWCVSIASRDCRGFGWLLLVVSFLFFLDLRWMSIWSFVHIVDWCLELWLCLCLLILGLIAHSSVSGEVLEGCLRSCYGRVVGSTPPFVHKSIVQLRMPKGGRVGSYAFFLCYCCFAAPDVSCASVEPALLAFLF